MRCTAHSTPAAHRAKETELVCTQRWLLCENQRSMQQCNGQCNGANLASVEVAASSISTRRVRQQSTCRCIAARVCAVLQSCVTRHNTTSCCYLLMLSCFCLLFICSWATVETRTTAYTAQLSSQCPAHSRASLCITCFNESRIFSFINSNYDQLQFLISTIPTFTVCRRQRSF